MPSLFGRNFLFALPSRFPRKPYQRGFAIVQFDRPGTAYVWNEPAGRIRSILDLQRLSEQRWKYLHRKYLEKLLETTRRARLSNDAWQPRLQHLEQQYQQIAYGMGQVARMVERLCVQYGAEKPAGTRRKFNFDRFDAYVVGGQKYDPRAKRDDDEEFVDVPATEADSTAPLLRPKVYRRADRRLQRDDRKRR